MIGSCGSVHLAIGGINNKVRTKGQISKSQSRGYNRTLNLKNKEGFEARVEGIILQCNQISFLFPK